MVEAGVGSVSNGDMKNLKIARILKGISQWDLSQKTGIPNYRISLIENGRVKPKPEELRALAEALQTTPQAIKEEVSEVPKAALAQ